jgi:hypothetical protein
MADEYDEVYTGDLPDSIDEYNKITENQRRVRHLQRQKDIINEVGLVPPPTPEVLEARKYYEDNYVAMHQEIFKRSTGMKPFGPVQEKSIKQTQNILTQGGRAVIAEPRGFGKTSRTSNNALMAILQGRIRYALILASSLTKAAEILESIKTELIDNQELQKLYPAVSRCFEALEEQSRRGKTQTYGGFPTHIGYTNDRIRFPQIPGEASCGSIIQVRSKDNVRGLFTKTKGGDGSGGSILRPDFVFLDDIQTDEEADSQTSAMKIIRTIKKSVLFAGSHHRRISAVMCCTPICPGDVSTHFILNEPSWEVTLYKMVEKMPDNLEMWLTTYADILMGFDRYKPGDRIRARIEARAFVEKNYDVLHEGAEVAWDWAYGWAEDPQTEISALQHAMNFLIEEGPESFETECQCNVSAKDADGEEVRATINQICEKVTHFPRYHCPVDTQFITTNIDVNKRILTYCTMSSPLIFRPSVIDYGTWPAQPGATWKKDTVVHSLARQYPDITEDHLLIYQGVKDLINKLHTQEYYREDGNIMHNHLITVDMGYQMDEVQRAIRDSEARSIVTCYRGQGIDAKRKQFMDRHYGPDCQKHFHCATTPTNDKLLMVLYTDVNFWKTRIHRGIKTRPGITGSIDLFETEKGESHLLLARHWISETPTEDYYPAEDRRVIVWSSPKGDNEYFDNGVGCLANFMKLGCKLRAKRHKSGTYNIQDYVNMQRKDDD